MITTSTIVITPESRASWRQFFQDVWTYRELFLEFLIKNLQVRYKQTVLGTTWVVLQPLFQTGAFSLVFGKLANMPTDGLPMVLFFFAGNLAWGGFSRGLTGAAGSIIGNTGMVTKIYFPRFVVPAAQISSSFVDFAVAWGVFALLATLQGYWHWSLLTMTPLLVVLIGLTALGPGLVLAALNAQYRDVRNAMNFITQMLMLATPVIYPVSKLPVWLHDWLFLNPMAVVVNTYRDCLLNRSVNWTQLLLALGMALVYAALGTWFFRKRESRFADVL